MNSFFRTVVLAALIALPLGSCEAFAQAGGQRPPRERGAATTSTPDHTLDVSFSVAEAYDDNLLAEVGPVSPGAAALSGLYTAMLADAAYGWRGRRSQFGATGGTALRYYNEGEELEASYTAGVGFSTELAKRTTIFANQTAAYSPSYLYGLFPSGATAAPGDAIPVAPDYAVSDLASYAYGTAVSIGRGVTRRGDMSASLDYRYTDFLRATQDRRDLSSYGARVQFSQGMARNASLILAYRYRAGDFGYGLLDGGKTTEHGFEIGVNYVRPLSPTRRLTFTADIGSSAADTPALVQLNVVDGLQYTVIGDVAFGYQFRRSWETRASYHRGLDYVPELAAPVYTDGVSASITGLFTPRMDFSAGVGYSTGASAIVRTAQTFDTYTASARVRQAISSVWAVYVEYLYYYYDFGRAQLPLGTPASIERNGVRVGVTVWVPTIRR